MKTIYNFNGFNEELFIWINQLTNINFLPHILKYISSIFFIANFAFIYSLFCVYFYFQTKKSPNPKEYFIPIYNKLIQIGICYTLFGCIFAYLKFYVNMPRPYCSLDSSKFLTIANTDLERCLSSFPSAHTGLCILTAYILWPYINKIGKLLALTLVLVVATSRITLAMHYPADIIYSALITFLIINFGNYIFNIIKTPIIEPIGKKILQIIIIKDK